MVSGAGCRVSEFGNNLTKENTHNEKFSRIESLASGYESS